MCTYMYNVHIYDVKTVKAKDLRCFSLFVQGPANSTQRVEDTKVSAFKGIVRLSLNLKARLTRGWLRTPLITWCNGFFSKRLFCTDALKKKPKMHLLKYSYSRMAPPLCSVIGW